VDSTRIRPRIWNRNEAKANWIIPHVVPLLGVAFTTPQRVMPTPRLESPVCPAMDPCNLPLPKGDPVLNLDTRIMRRAEAVQVVRQQDVIANEPSCGGTPCGLKRSLCLGTGEPPSTAFGGNREEDHCRLAGSDPDTG